MTASPYNLWTSRKSLGVMRDMKSEIFHFGQFFINGMRSTTEWIDFGKLPIKNRDLAPFVKPKGKGRGLSTDKIQGYRFKPANIVLEDALDMDRGFTYEPGIDGSPYDVLELDPMTRRDLIIAQMLADFNDAMDRRFEWMKARAIIDGAVTITYEDGESFALDFQRDAGNTEVLTSGNYYGDSGVSIVDHWQTVFDTMNNLAFGGLPTKITMGGSVASVVRKDTEVLSHLDRTVDGGTIRVDRGIVGAPDGGKVYKFGELIIGGASGQRVELWVNNEEYRAASGTMTRYLGAKEVVFTSTPQAINGYECYGRIVDKDARFEALPKFPKNYEVRNGRVVDEYVSMESAPLFVPINPNATYKATVLA